MGGLSPPPPTKESEGALQASPASPGQRSLAGPGTETQLKLNFVQSERQKKLSGGTYCTEFSQ